MSEPAVCRVCAETPCVRVGSCTRAYTSLAILRRIDDHLLADVDPDADA